MGAKGVKYGRCGAMLDGNREKRAKNHIGCGMAGLLFYLNAMRPPLLRGQAFYGRFGCVPNGGVAAAQAPPFKGGVDDAALALPLRAIGQKHRIAQQRAQPLAQAAGFGEILRAVFEHQLHQVGLVDQERAEKRRAKLGHPGTIQPRGLRR